VERQRKKAWDEKVKIVNDSFLRVKDDPAFASDFYLNLFFLKPKIKDYFKNTDFEHQHKALMRGLEFMMGFLDHSDANARQQVVRISQTHSKKNMNIHPHDYYYWLEALILTVKSHDKQWHQDMIYYWREVISFPITFIISQYFTPVE
jgi:hemoglobin-like flavoprotein